MARELRCADLMPGCNFVAQCKDDSEVMRRPPSTRRAPIRWQRFQWRLRKERERRSGMPERSLPTRTRQWVHEAGRPLIKLAPPRLSCHEGDTRRS
jgi:hypothetical protein